MNFLLPAAPVTLTHIGLSFWRDSKNCFPILDPDAKLTILVPVYNEPQQIESTLESIMDQTMSPGQIIISDNGSTDATSQVIKRYLEKKGYSLQGSFASSFPSQVYTNLHYPPVTLIRYTTQTSKAESINRAKESGLIKHTRTLVVDSDTRLDCKFIEQISRYYCTLSVHKGRALIRRSSILGATALPKRRAGAGFQEKIVAMGREVEYTFGHFLVRRGQNHTALYVATGCGFTCSTHLLSMSGRTVVDDLELTQRVQSKKALKKLSQKELERFLKKRYMVATPEGNRPLAHILEKFANQVYLLDNLATYVPSACMYTQDPRAIRSLWHQIYRWTSGFHQVMFLEGRNFVRKNKKVGFTMYGNLFEGLLGGIFFLFFPGVLLYEAVAGYTLFQRYLLTLYGLDAALQIVFLGVSMYERGRLQGESKVSALKYGLINAVKNLPSFYILRFINSVCFLYTYIRIKVEVGILKKRAWNSTWRRG